MSTSDDYGRFAAALIADGVLLDPWYEGQPRFAREPVRLSAARWAALREAAERVAAAYNELCVLCAREPEHLDGFFALTPYQKLMWAASAPAWHGFARADLFETDEGLACCELNCDTPTGEPEAALLSAAALREAGDEALQDPNAGLERRFGAMLETLARGALGEGHERTVGLVYPTDLTEDLPLVRLYDRWLRARGYDVVLGSPFNLALDRSGVPSLFGRPCPIVLRHYKTDWWGEREAAFTDEAPYDDAEPLHEPLALLLEAELAGRCVVVNPFGAVLPQNKKAMAFFWERLPRFSPESQEAIRRFVPYTVRAEALHREQLSAQRAEWVLKSDYGCEGDEVIIGAECTQAEWDAALAVLRPGRFVAQRYFRARPLESGETANLGVYVVAGQAAGIYARVQRGATDVRARSAPVLVEP